MSTRRTQRQIAAIISVDVVGFSRLMGADEDGPDLPFTTGFKCCDAARHCSRSCIVQQFVGSNVGQRTKWPPQVSYIRYQFSTARVAASASITASIAEIASATSLGVAEISETSS